MKEEIIKDLKSESKEEKKSLLDVNRSLEHSFREKEKCILSELNSSKEEIKKRDDLILEKQ